MTAFRRRFLTSALTPLQPIIPNTKSTLKAGSSKLGNPGAGGGTDTLSPLLNHELGYARKQRGTDVVQLQVIPHELENVARFCNKALKTFKTFGKSSRRPVDVTA